MELKCKRCQHRWNYRGHKRPNADYPLYVTCPRCRTVVKLKFRTPRDRKEDSKTPDLPRPATDPLVAQAEAAERVAHHVNSAFMLTQQLKGGGRMMTTQNPTRKRGLCPNCHAPLKSLNFLVRKSVFGEFTLDTGREEDICDNEDSIVYFCRKCGADLFDDDESAEDFLLGKTVRPTVLEQNKVRNANVGKLCANP